MSGSPRPLLPTLVMLPVGRSPCYLIGQGRKSSVPVRSLMSTQSSFSLLCSLSLLATACGGYASTAGPEHCGAIGDEVWGRDLSPHDVTCDVTVTGDLTIGPGTRVRFAPNTTLIVQGSLAVQGEEGREVTFEEAEDGQGWVGVWVRPWDEQEVDERPVQYDLLGEGGLSTATGAPASVPQGDVQLAHLTVKTAGLSLGDLRGGGLILERGPVLLDHVTIEGSLGCGITFGESGRLHPDSQEVNVASSESATVCAHAMAVSSLLPEVLALTAEDELRITDGEVAGTHRWQNLGTPYVLEDGLAVFRANLTVDAGVELQVYPGNRIQVGEDTFTSTYGTIPYGRGADAWFRDQLSKLVLAGTAAAPVLVTVASPGDAAPRWEGIQVVSGPYGKAEADFRSVEIERAGYFTGGVPASLTIRGEATVFADGLTIRDGTGAGILIDEDATGFTTDSKNVTVTGQAYAAVVTPVGLLSLPKEGSTYSGNTSTPSGGTYVSADAIYVTPGKFEKGGTWRALGVPFIAQGLLEVTDPTGSGSTFAIEPGVEARFPAASYFRAGKDGGVTLTVGQEGGREVLFAAANPEKPWVGLELGESLREGSAIHNLRILAAGARESQGAVDLVGTVKTTGLNIEDSAGIGLTADGAFTEDSRGLGITGAKAAVVASPDAAGSLPEAGARIVGNVENVVLVDGSRLTRSGVWGDLGVPYQIERQLYVSGVVDAVGDPFPTELRVTEGVTMLFGPTAGLRTEKAVGDDFDEAAGTIVMQGTPTKPIVLTARVPAEGWTGIVFRDEDSFPVEDRSALTNVVVEYGGAIFSFGGLTFEDSTIPVDNVVVRKSWRYGVSLIGDAFVADPEGDRFDLFPAARSEFTFEDNNPDCLGEDGEGLCIDVDVIDFRVFLTTP